MCDRSVPELNKLIKRAASNLWYYEERYPDMDWNNKHASLGKSARRAFNDYKHNQVLHKEYSDELSSLLSE